MQSCKVCIKHFYSNAEGVWNLRRDFFYLLVYDKADMNFAEIK